MALPSPNNAACGGPRSQTEEEEDAVEAGSGEHQPGWLEDAERDATASAALQIALYPR